MKISFTHAIFVAILSCVLCRPVRREDSMMRDIESLLGTNWKLIRLTVSAIVYMFV